MALGLRATPVRAQPILHSITVTAKGLLWVGYSGGSQHFSWANFKFYSDRYMTFFSLTVGNQQWTWALGVKGSLWQTFGLYTIIKGLNTADGEAAWAVIYGSMTVTPPTDLPYGNCVGQVWLKWVMVFGKCPALRSIIMRNMLCAKKRMNIILHRKPENTLRNPTFFLLS